MADHLRTQAGPWCGGLRDTSVVIRASVLRSVRTARVILAEDEQLSRNPTAHHVESMWSDPERSYRHQIASFTPRDLRPDTQLLLSSRAGWRHDEGLAGSVFALHHRSVRRLAFALRSSGCARPPIVRRHTPGSVQGRGRAAGPALLLSSRGLSLPRHRRRIGGPTTRGVRRHAASRGWVTCSGGCRRRIAGTITISSATTPRAGMPHKSSARRFARDGYDIYVPHYPLASTGEGIYQSFQIGRVLFLLTDSRFAKSPRSGSGTSGKTVLGINQKVWLKRRAGSGQGSRSHRVGQLDPVDRRGRAGRGLLGRLCDRARGAMRAPRRQRHPQCLHDQRRRAHGGHRRRQSRRIRVGRTRRISGVPGGGPREPRIGEGRTLLLSDEHGGVGPGIAGKRQFGVFEIDYDVGQPGPRVVWTAHRAEKETAAVQELMRYEFPARQTFASF